MVGGTVDEARLSGDLKEARPAGWVFHQWGRSFILFILIVAVVELVVGGWGGLSGWWGGGLWVRMGLAWVVATLATWWEWRSLQAPPDERVRSLVREWEEMTAPGWPLRTAKRGVWMGFFVAVPVGALIAWLLPSPEVPEGGRLLVFLMFLGMTLLWTIPMAFLIRLMAVNSYKAYLQEGKDAEQEGTPLP
jgi:hypothetical protein